MATRVIKGTVSPVKAPRKDCPSALPPLLWEQDVGGSNPSAPTSFLLFDEAAVATAVATFKATKTSSLAMPCAQGVEGA